MRQLKITKQVTNRETASLDKYLQEIGKVELITADEEVDLAQRIRAGDRAALEKLIKANLRFVVSVSKQYQNQGLSLPDLINEGNLGLMKAAKGMMKLEVSNSSLTRFGGFVSRFYRLWQNSREL
jgi:RNA polymerase primary sigma factor